MAFAYICFDRGDQSAARQKHLLGHLRHMEAIADKVIIAGPVPATAPGDSRRHVGSMIVYGVNTREEADALFNGDPYADQDMWERVEIVAFNPAMGTAIGGVTWEIVDGQVKMKPPR